MRRRERPSGGATLRRPWPFRRSAAVESEPGTPEGARPHRLACRHLEYLRRMMACPVALRSREPPHEVVGSEMRHHVCYVAHRVRRAPRPVLGRDGHPQATRRREQLRALAQGCHALRDLVRRNSAKPPHVLGGKRRYAMGKRPVRQVGGGHGTWDCCLDDMIHISQSNLCSDNTQFESTHRARNPHPRILSADSEGLNHLKPT